MEIDEGRSGAKEL